MTDIDHRAQAVNLAAKAIGKENRSDELGAIAVALVANVHATLALSEPKPDTALMALGGRLTELREAVRTVLDTAPRVMDISGEALLLPPAVAERLRDLIGDPS